MMNSRSNISLLEYEIKLLAALSLNVYYKTEVSNLDFRNELSKEIFQFINTWEKYEKPIPMNVLYDMINSCENYSYGYYEIFEKEYNLCIRELNSIELIILARRDNLRLAQYKEDILTILTLLEKDIKKSKSHDEISRIISEIKIIEYKNNIDIIPSTLIRIDNIFNEHNYVKSGLHEIDKSGGISRGNMIGLVADSGMQKTMFTLWWLMKILEINPEMKGAYFEKEMPASEIAKRVLSYLTKVPNDKLLGNEKENVKEIWQKHKNNSIISRLKIISNDKFDNADDIHKIIVKENIDIWVLDYLTHLYPSNNINYDLFLKEQVIKLKTTLNETKSIGIIISQIKHTSNLESRINKIPTYSDMEYGKMLKQNSSYVFSLFFPHYYYDKIKSDWIYLIPRKTRDGNLKIMSLNCNPAICTYNEPINSYEQDIWIREYINKKR